MPLFIFSEFVAIETCLLTGMMIFFVRMALEAGIPAGYQPGVGRMTGDACGLGMGLFGMQSARLVAGSAVGLRLDKLAFKMAVLTGEIRHHGRLFIQTVTARAIENRLPVRSVALITEEFGMSAGKLPVVPVIRTGKDAGAHGTQP